MSNAEPILNVNAASSDWRAYALANFPLFPFILDGLVLASVEGFIQGIKFPDGDATREAAFLSHSLSAKQMGERAERVSVWWNGQSFPYGSGGHHRQIARAIRAKLFFNEGTRLALRATDGLKLVHDLGPESPNTSLPSAVFCHILTELRDELLRTGSIERP